MDAPALLDPPPLLRRLRADEAPYPGVLRAGEPPRVWVDAGTVPVEVWRAAADGHLLAPLDLARVPGGHAALVPHCPQRLGACVAEAAIGPGEAVTLAVSILRGACEARTQGLSCGSWWCDDSGRPVLAAGGQSPWDAEAADLLTTLERAAGPRLADALARVRDLVLQERVARADADACEDALFAAHEPAPLGPPGIRGPHGALASWLDREPVPRRVDTLPAGASARVRLRDDKPDAASRSIGAWVGRFADHDLGARTAAAVGAVRGMLAAPPRRDRRRQAARRSEPATGGDPAGGERPRRRRLPLVVAAAAAATVLALGAWWPDDAPDAVAVSSQAPTSAPAPSESASPGEAPDATPVDAGAGGPDASTTDVHAVLDALTACARAAAVSCPGVMEDAAAPLPTGAAGATDAERELALLDEYGGVAVYRVAAAGYPTQALVLVSANGSWLIRDVYDLADQP
ncbi:hypothetical protein [Microbacterium sp.]|uniref:hypothetical protein n=1 Tax=Microbacterium sp. TaxID=51671 RepID=UPI0039E7028D